MALSTLCDNVQWHKHTHTGQPKSFVERCHCQYRLNCQYFVVTQSTCIAILNYERHQLTNELVQLELFVKILNDQLLFWCFSKQSTKYIKVSCHIDWRTRYLTKRLGYFYKIDINHFFCHQQTNIKFDWLINYCFFFTF